MTNAVDGLLDLRDARAEIGRLNQLVTDARIGETNARARVAELEGERDNMTDTTTRLTEATKGEMGRCEE